MVAARHVLWLIAFVTLAAAPASANEDTPTSSKVPKEFSVAAGPMVTLVTGEFDYFTQVTGGFRIAAGFHLHQRLEALVSFDWSSAHKRHLSPDDSIIFFGVHGGLRYRAPTSRGFSMFVEALLGSQFTRLATSEVATDNGFGARVGLGAIVPVGGDFSLIPMVGYSVGLLDGPNGDTAALNQFLFELTIRWDL